MRKPVPYPQLGKGLGAFRTAMRQENVRTYTYGRISRMVEMQYSEQERR